MSIESQTRDACIEDAYDRKIADLEMRNQALKAERDIAMQTGYELGWLDGTEYVRSAHAGRAQVLIGPTKGLRPPKPKDR